MEKEIGTQYDKNPTNYTRIYYPTYSVDIYEEFPVKFTRFDDVTIYKFSVGFKTQDEMDLYIGRMLRTAHPNKNQHT